MRIAISGTNNQRKTDLLQQMLVKWPEYQTPETDYKDTIERIAYDFPDPEDIKSCDIQWDILNDMLDVMQTYKEDDKVIFNRCPLDNIVYSLYLHEKEPDVAGIDNAFIEKCIPIVRESMKFLDIIYTVPITSSEESEYEIEDKEIDNLFLMMFKESQKDTSTFFPGDDRPAVIEVFGSDQERVKMISMYLDDEGELIGGDPEFNNIIDPNLSIENFQ